MHERETLPADVAHPRSPDDLKDVGTVTLTRALVERLGELVKREVDLARAEVTEDLRHGKLAGELGGTAVGALFAAMVCALVAILDGLAYVMPMWLAALIGLVLFLGVAAWFGFAARKEARRAVPKRTEREARATVQMLTERTA